MGDYRWACAATLIWFWCTGNLSAQEPVPWHDPSPHSIQFVTVDENVKLEVLDWGGSGKPLVLLAGLGNTAHVFDDFAPKLAFEYSRLRDHTTRVQGRPAPRRLATQLIGSVTTYLLCLTHSNLFDQCLQDTPSLGRS